MNLTKLEKGIIIFLVVGGILAAGIFFFVLPAYQNIEKANRNLEAAQKQEQELRAKLELGNDIDEKIETAKRDARAVEKDFYPDLTTYEAVEITLAHLKKCDLDTLSMSTGMATAEDLVLSVYDEKPLIYNLKTMSETARGEDPNALLEGEFRDGSKVYTVTVANVYDIKITDNETGAEVEKSKYNNVMKAAYKEALCRYASTTEIEENVGATQVSFTVTGKYEDYLKFLDYICNIDRATCIKAAAIPITMEAEEKKKGGTFDEDGNYITQDITETRIVVLDEEPETIVEEDITIYYLSVEPMEEVTSITAADRSITLDQ